MIQLGRIMPAFVLHDIDGASHALEEVQDSILVLVFWSAECPWSRRADEYLAAWRRSWGARVVIWMIASNSNEDLSSLREAAAERELENVLIDSDQKLADELGAITTPHCFVLDEQHRLRYQGGIDDVAFGKPEASVFYLKDAVDALLSGDPVETAETPSFGCTIVRMKPGTN